MRRNDSSSGEMQDAADTIPAVDSAETPMEVTKSKHVKIPPPNITTNGIKSASVSPQQPFGRQSRPQSANKIQFGGNKGPGAPVRYFILKSTNRENVERSIEQGVWSTQVYMHGVEFQSSSLHCPTVSHQSQKRLFSCSNILGAVMLSFGCNSPMLPYLWFAVYCLWTYVCIDP